MNSVNDFHGIYIYKKEKNEMGGYIYTFTPPTFKRKKGKKGKKREVEKKIKKGQKGFQGSFQVGFCGDDDWVTP